MKQEDKKLLLQDLSARLPYGVKVRFYNHWEEKYEILPLTAKLLVYTVHIEEIPPYLFPLSSMTAEQLFEVQDILGKDEIKIDDGFLRIVDSDRNTISYLEIFALLEWFYENHFDINNLIPKGLAKDATGKNIY